MGKVLESSRLTFQGTTRSGILDGVIGRNLTTAPDWGWMKVITEHIAVAAFLSSPRRYSHSNLNFR
jgi:hypothetical protein